MYVRTPRAQQQLALKYEYTDSRGVNYCANERPQKMKVGRVQGDSGGFEVCFVTYGGRHKIVANTSREVITYRPPDMFLCL